MHQKLAQNIYVLNSCLRFESTVSFIKKKKETHHPGAVNVSTLA
jgi:hypothetical protein